MNYETVLQFRILHVWMSYGLIMIICVHCSMWTLSNSQTQQLLITSLIPAFSELLPVVSNLYFTCFNDSDWDSNNPQLYSILHCFIPSSTVPNSSPPVSDSVCHLQQPQYFLNSRLKDVPMGLSNGKEGSIWCSLTERFILLLSISVINVTVLVTACIVSWHVFISCLSA